MTTRIARRRFLATAPTGAVLMLSGSNQEDSIAHNTVQVDPQSPRYVIQSGSLLEATNLDASWTFDLRSGALIRAENKRFNFSTNFARDAAAPLRAWLAQRDGSGQIEVSISQTQPRRLNYEVWRSGAELLLFFSWPNLDADGEASGLTITQSYRMTPNDNSLQIKTSLKNCGHRWLTGLFLGIEKVIVNPDGYRERLLAGDVNGQPHLAPRHELKEGRGFVPYPAGKRSFSIPPTVPTSMVLNWMDLSDDSHGLGTGYADAQELDMVAHVAARPEGIDLGWRFFRLEGSRGFMWGYNGETQIYPLAPGEQFESDPWFLLLHDGDWHRTADAYRQCYEQAFGDDFLNWARTSPAVKRSDLVLNNFVAWGAPPKEKSQAYDYPRGYVVNRFEDIPAEIQAAIIKLGIDPSNVLINLLGTGPNWGIYKMPDHFPMVEEAGGQQAAAETCHRLLNLGVSGLCFYAHPYFMHRDAANYVAAAETELKYPHQDWHTSMGGIACMGSDEWHDMWVRKIYTRYAALGVNALYFDEGFGHQFICTRGDHSHGISASSVLSAQSRGASRLYRSWRKNAGPNGYLACESGSDVQARLIDLWHFSSPTSLMRYTHPDKLIMAGLRPDNITESVAHAFLMGCPLMIAPLPGPLGSPEPLEGELLRALRRFVILRRQMREEGVPGYPQGFRDDVGIQKAPAGLRGRLYSDGSGVTFVFFAEQSTKGQVQIDTSRLRQQGRGVLTRTVVAEAKEMGYFVIRG